MRRNNRGCANKTRQNDSFAAFLPRFDSLPRKWPVFVPVLGLDSRCTVLRDFVLQYMFLTQRNLKSCAAFFFLISVLLSQLRSDLLTQFKLHFPDLLFCFRISVDSFLFLAFYGLFGFFILISRWSSSHLSSPSC